MRAVITVVGKDRVGILAAVANSCAEQNLNIIDVNQTVMEDYFTMTMLTEVDDEGTQFDSLKEKVEQSVPDMKVHVMHEDIFNSMHRI